MSGEERAGRKLGLFSTKQFVPTGCPNSLVDISTGSYAQYRSKFKLGLDEIVQFHGAGCARILLFNSNE